MQHSSRTLMAGAAGAVALLAAMGGAARADILPSANSPTAVLQPNGTFLYSYDVFVSAAQQVNNGDFFIIYDFNGFLGVTAQPANFLSNVENLSPAPIMTTSGSVTPNDNAAIPNVRFTYTGTTPILGGAGEGGTGAPLGQTIGTFTLRSSFAPSNTIRAFVGRGTDQQTGAKNANINNVTGPGTQPIPEPGEWAFAAVSGSGLLGLMARARRRAKATKATSVAA